MRPRSKDAELAAMYAALGQENRLPVFRLLSQRRRAWKPQEIADELGMTYMTAHYHLSRLADAGLAQAEEGRGNGYRVVPGVTERLKNFTGRRVAA